MHKHNSLSALKLLMSQKIFPLRFECALVNLAVKLCKEHYKNKSFKGTLDYKVEYKKGIVNLTVNSKEFKFILSNYKLTCASFDKNDKPGHQARLILTPLYIDDKKSFYKIIKNNKIGEIFMIFLAIFVILTGIIVIYFTFTQNSLVSLEEFCRNSLSQITVQQQSRWDALTSLFELTKGYSSHENNTLKEIISARQNLTPRSTVAEIQNQENLISKGFAGIHAVAEAYPELKADSVYLKTMDGVKDYENNVRMSRMVYNDSVTKFNRQVRSFPASFIANLLRFTQKDYLDEKNGIESKGMPSFNK